MKIKLSIALIFCLVAPLVFNSCKLATENNVKAQETQIPIQPNDNRSSTSVNFNSQIEKESSKKIPTITSSNILEEINRKKTENPQITDNELADFGNKLLPQRGFNFDIDLAELIEQKNKLKETKIISVNENTFERVIFPIQMTLKNDKQKMFQLIAPNEESCCCGYYYTEFPVSKITDKLMTIVVDGKQYQVKRIKEISFNQEHYLVDNKTKKKVIRKWQVPLESYPYGISKDGTKLYIDLEENNLLLEIVDNGNFQFVPKTASSIITNGKDLRQFPSPKVGEILEKSGEYGFMKFTSGDKIFVIKFAYICT